MVKLLMWDLTWPQGRLRTLFGNLKNHHKKIPQIKAYLKKWKLLLEGQRDNLLLLDDKVANGRRNKK